MPRDVCPGYCGITCVDGTCPMANREEYAERGYDIVHNCDECHYYRGCEDCYFAEDHVGCPEPLPEGVKRDAKTNNDT